jgi:hypothetical protein
MTRGDACADHRKLRMAESKERKTDERIADIDQLGRAGESIGGRSLPPVREPLQNDAIEIWGRRIGRVLGWTAVVFLLIQLVRIYGQ